MHPALVIAFVGALVFGAHLFIALFAKIRVPDVLLLISIGLILGPLLNQIYSARALAAQISAVPNAPPLVCVDDARRDVWYGLAFYRNQPIPSYGEDGVPAVEHIVVVSERAVPTLRTVLAGRQYEPLFGYAAQNLVVYRVFAK